MYNRLQELCRKKNTNVTELCVVVTGSSGNLGTWKKGHMRSDYLAKCADILGCSTDYILGRTDADTIINNTGNTYTDSPSFIVSGSNTININQAAPLSEQLEEVIKVLKKIKKNVE